MHTEIAYGKQNITLYRTYATSLTGLALIPESRFTGRANTLFAADVGVDVLGDNFLPAYTEGDNRNVVATDTMKNFVLQQALAYPGATLEGLLDYLGRGFLATYGQMQQLRMTGSEVPFAAPIVPGDDGNAFAASDVLFSQSRADHATAEFVYTRNGDDTHIAEHRCGLLGIRLIKLTGSSFAGFDRDRYTTLEERPDRPLFIHLDLSWRYADAADALGNDPCRYVAAEQVRDVTQAVFHSFVSMSIQHLVHEIGQRLLERFPQLSEVGFVAQNRLWDTAFVAEGHPQIKVYCDPRPPYGQIELTLKRD